MPAWVSGTKLAKLQAAVKERLPSKLETKLLFDPQTKLISGPTESPEAFTARVAQKQEVSKDATKLLQKLEKKRADVAQLEQEVNARKAEKWLTVGAGVMGLFGGRRSALTSANRAMSSHRMQGGSEARLEDLVIEVQQLEADLAGLKDIDARRFEEEVCVPRSSDVQVLRLTWAWIVP
jgi:phytoene dehydrogenase-like protein